MFVCRNVSLYLLPGIQHHKNSNPFFFANFPDDMLFCRNVSPCSWITFKQNHICRKNQYEHKERERERENTPAAFAASPAPYS
jgi:hypothetical protein